MNMHSVFEVLSLPGYIISRSKEKMTQAGRRSKGHLLFRLPLTMMFGTILFVELIAYFWVRFIVAVLEYIFARRAHAGKELHRRRRTAKTYDEFKSVCQCIDLQENREEWKQRPESQHYDSELIRSATNKIRQAREAGDAHALMSRLRVNRNFGGMMNLELYTKTWCGTKELIRDYVDEVTRSIRWLDELKIPEGTHLHNERCTYFQLAKAEFGNTVLFLSGGAMMGLYHLGVVKALLQQKLLPKIISGTSAGSVVGALVGSRTDEELLAELSDTSLNLVRRFGVDGPFWGGKLHQLSGALRNGVMYDTENFFEKIKWFTRDYTFLEAYEATGRVLNITCTPAKTKVKGHPPIMLNYVSAPDVPIAHAVVASSCIPLLMAPVALMERVRNIGPVTKKNRYKRGADGGYVERPFLEQVDDLSTVRMRDGTFESDLPFMQMAHAFNSQFSIVSQVNPHVLPFFFNNSGEAGKPLRSWYRKGGWRGGFVLSLAELWLKEDMLKNLRIVGSLRLLFDVFGVDFSNLWLQESVGDLTITPPLDFRDFWSLTENIPGGEAGKVLLEERIEVSERNTWKAIPMVSNRMRIQEALDAAFLRHTMSTTPLSPFTPAAPAEFSGVNAHSQGTA